jgi:rhomboid protease GluP
MRKTQGSMICSNCGKLISVGEEKCPFCGAWRPGLFGYAPALQKLFGRHLDLIPMIVTACVVLYGVSLILDPAAIFRSFSPFSILSPSSDALVKLGMTGAFALRAGWWWTLLTAIYLHGGLLHIFFNVMWIRNLGPAVEDAYGPARGFVIFSIAGAVGFLVSDLVSVSPTVGASGSIFGLLAALIVYGRRHHISMLTNQLWQWAALMFVIGFVMPSVNNWAHAGGFAGGWITAQLMASSEKRESLPVLILALALLVLTAAGFVLSFVNVTRLLMMGR